MTLSKEAIEEYKQIYKKNFGEEISDKEAVMGNHHGFLVLNAGHLDFWCNRHNIGVNLKFCIINNIHNGGSWICPK